MPLLILKNFRIVDETTDAPGSVIVEDGFIREVRTDSRYGGGTGYSSADIVLDGGLTSQNSGLVLMPAFVDLHAHFRDAGGEARLPSETLESACLAAAAGGYGTVVCMANTVPVTDTIARARSVKNRCDALGIIDVYPALSLTKGMEGKELSEITLLPGEQEEPRAGHIVRNDCIRLVSEDGKDVADEALLLSAMAEARRIEIPEGNGADFRSRGRPAVRGGIPLSCHCDLGGENNAVQRILELGKRSPCRLHIAHVSTKEAAAMIREAKKDSALFSCEATPHHIALTEKDAAALGGVSHGRVNPPLGTEEDRQALIAAVRDGTIDAIATDHAPHSRADKEKGAPGFTGLETAFAVCYSTLVAPEGDGPAGFRREAAGPINLSRLSALMSAAPAGILGLNGQDGRGRIAPGMRADFAVADLSAVWTADPAAFMSRGKNSPFAGRKLKGKIVMTIRGGRVVYNGGGI